MDIFQEPKFWVGLSFVVFVALSYKKVGGMLISALDSRTQKIKEELAQAEALRIEAEKILEEYKSKQAHTMKEAEQMLEKAAQDAASLRAAAEKELKQSIESRTQQAMDRIAQEETKAIEEVRNHVVDIALSSARTMLAERAKKSDQSTLIKLALSDIERKIH
jgi:F-type H+-transporting ATPase subunit b